MQPSTLDFLKALRQNNNRDWFSEHKNLFIQAQQDVIGFVELVCKECTDFDDELPKTDAKKSLFRIYRDTRFSQNKEPYKTNFGISLGMGKGNQKAGYYLHIEPGKSFVGAGIYMLESDTLRKVRKEISAFPEEFRNILADKNFRNYFPALDQSNALKRIPQGFEKEDPMADYLKLKNYIVVHSLADEQLSAHDAPHQIAQIMRAAHLFNQFINTVLL